MYVYVVLTNNILGTLILVYDSMFDLIVFLVVNYMYYLNCFMSLLLFSKRPYADISITKQTAQSLTSKSLPLAGSKVQPKSSKSHSASVPTKSSMSRPTSRARSRAASRAG